MVAVSKCKTLLDLATLWGMQEQYHTLLAQVAAAAAAAVAAAAATAVPAAAAVSTEAVTNVAITTTNEPSHRYGIISQV
jgi:hypothetical protein